MTNQAANQPQIDLNKLKRALAVSKKPKLFQAIVNSPFKQKFETGSLFLGFIVLYAVDYKTRTVKCVSVSDTEQYKMSVKGYDFEPTDYQLSLDKDCDNDIVKAVLSGQPQDTTDWKNLSRRSADPEQARLNQASGGIAYSAIYPLKKAASALMFGYFQYPENINDHQRSFMEKYSQIVSAALATA